MGTSKQGARRAAGPPAPPGTYLRALRAPLICALDLLQDHRSRVMWGADLLALRYGGQMLPGESRAIAGRLHLPEVPTAIAAVPIETRWLAPARLSDAGTFTISEISVQPSKHSKGEKTLEIDAVLMSTRGKTDGLSLAVLFRDGAGNLLGGVDSIAVPPMYQGTNDLSIAIRAAHVPEGTELDGVELDVFPST